MLKAAGEVHDCALCLHLHCVYAVLILSRGSGVNYAADLSSGRATLDLMDLLAEMVLLEIR